MSKVSHLIGVLSSHQHLTSAFAGQPVTGGVLADPNVRRHWKVRKTFIRHTALMSNSALAGILLFLNIGGANAESSSSTTPELVQHVSSSSTRNSSFSSPYCYHTELPNRATAGNAVVVGFTYSSTAKPRVLDDRGNSYQLIASYYDSVYSQSAGIAAAFNIAGGGRRIFLCFNGENPGQAVQPVATEFANVVGVDNKGIGNSGNGTAVTAGSMTPTQRGDLIYEISASNNHSFYTSAQTHFTADPRTQLLSADLIDGLAAEFGVYNSVSPINPTMKLETGTNWVAASVLLKSGKTGGVPSGLRVVHLFHESYNAWEYPTPTPGQFPSSGNLLVAMVGGGVRAQVFNGITDSNNNKWQQAGKPYWSTSGQNAVQIYYAANAASSSDLSMSVGNPDAANATTIFFYDVAGAATSPLDKATGGSGSQSSAGYLKMPFTITPAKPQEIIFSQILWDYNTGWGLIGQLFDADWFSGESESGPEPVDQNNGWGHVITTNTNRVGFTWQFLYNIPANNWASDAAAFMAAPP